MPIIAGPDGKRISFPEGTSDSDIAAAFGSTAPQAQTPPLHTAQPSVPPTPPANTGGEGIGSKIWSWANQPLNIGHLRESIKAGEDSLKAPDTMDEVNHPIRTMIKTGLTGFGTDAAKMLLTPLSGALAATGAVGEIPGALGDAARAIGVPAALGFAAHGAKDVAQNPGMQPSETGPQYAGRLAQDAAMVAGGAGEGAHLYDTAKIFRGSAPETSAPSVTPPVDPATAGAMRKAQAVGNPTGPRSATIHVDPSLAGEIDQWNQTDLPGKRIMLKSTKSGGNTLKLAHIDPDTLLYHYTDTKSDPSYSDDGDQVAGQVPVQLYKNNGVRGTSVPGHFLANEIGEETAKPVAPSEPSEQVVDATPANPIAAPETPLPAPATSAPVLPQPETVATPPAASEAQNPVSAQTTPVQPIESKPVIPTTNPDLTPPVGGLPASLSKSTPNYGYKGKNFKLDFEDPKDLAAYTVSQKTPNKAHEQFMTYLRGEFPDLSDEQIRARGLAVRDSIKDSAKYGNPAEGPLKVAKLGDVPAATSVSPMSRGPIGEEDVPLHPEPLPEDATGGVGSGRVTKPAERPPVDVSALEDQIRPTVGKLLNLKRLKTGEAVSSTIDKAIEATHTLGDTIDPNDRPKIAKLLGEPVGDNLTGDQILKLEQLRGAGERGKARLVPLASETSFARLSSDPEGYRQERESQMVDMVHALNDPDTPEDLKEKITKAMMTDSFEDGGRDFVYLKGRVRYPRPSELPADHPEAPFEGPQLGHSITPLNDRNARAIFKGSYKDLLRLDSNKDIYVKPEERQELARLAGEDVDSEQPDNLITSEEQKHLDLLSTGPSDRGVFDLKDLLGVKNDEGEDTGSGRVFSANDTKVFSKEYDDYRRQLTQRVLDLRIGKMEQELRSKVGEWNAQRGPDPTPLVDQLSKLSPEARKLLPEELFNEKPSTAAQSGSESTSGIGEGTQATQRTPKKSTTIRSGAATATEGVKHTNWDKQIQKEFPEAVKNLPTIQQATEAFPADSRQQQYVRAMQTYYGALKQNDPFAIKQALDTIVRPNESGFIDFSKHGTGAYTPDQAVAINQEVAHNFLTRWEAMSESELLKKRDGLRADSLVQRLEQSKPVSEDPETAMDQAETYNELKARHDALLEAAGPTTHIYDSLMDWMNNFIEARSDKRMMREVRGTQARNDAIMKQEWSGLDTLMNTLSLPEQDRFFDNVTRGSAQSDKIFKAMDPDTIAKWEKKNGPIPDPNKLASLMRASLDAARDRLTAASGNLEEFLVNYMPGMYDNQAKARAFAQSWVSRRPLEGGSEFLKQKMYEFHSDALKAGLQPSTSNPIRAMLMRIEQLNRYTMAHEFKNKLVEDGQTSWYNVGETPPEGHEILNDRIFGQGGQGSYFAPSKVARTFNNFVSTGLTGGWKVPYTDLSLYDGLRNTNNLANQMQLGFSLFHGVETTLNSAFTATSVGLRQVLNEGQVLKGGVNIMKGATGIVPLVEDAWNGSKGLINFRDPTKALDYAQLGNDLEAVNANVRTDPTFRLQQVENLRKNWNTATDGLMPGKTRAMAVAKAGTNLLGSAAEGLSAPLMNWLIPRVKLGAFYRMAQEVHEANVGQPPDVINSELQKAWDSVDNRFGQVNYDNMFLNKTTKDLMSLTVRSPGWNIGTAREVGGGLWDAGVSLKDAAQGKGFKITNRTAYTAAMVSGTMLVNALYQYLHTGQSAQGMDYFFPKDGTKSAQGEDNRVYPKTYVYDFINTVHDPIGTLGHKAAPDISTMYDLVKNEDYYHRQIRDPGNSPVQNAASTLGYMAHQFVPFSFGNFQEARLRGKSGADIGSFAGILPAPRWAGRSAAENLAYNYYEGAQAQSPTDEGTLEKKAAFIDLRNKVSRGELTDDDIQKALDSGKLQPKMVKYLYDTKTDPDTGKPIVPQVVNWVKPLRSEQQVWNVWKAATPEEKKILLPTVIEKMATLSSGEQQDKYFKELEDFANTP